MLLDCFSILSFGEIYFQAFTHYLPYHVYAVVESQINRKLNQNTILSLFFP